MGPKCPQDALLALLKAYGSTERCLLAKNGASAPLRKLQTRQASSAAAITTGRRDPTRAQRSRESHASKSTSSCQLGTASYAQSRDYATAALDERPGKQPKSVAVLGGGVTGLTTAYYLSRFLPQAHITLYEASDRLGGWINSQEVDVTTPTGKHGRILFESGPRTLASYARSNKYDDLVLYELIDQLQLHGKTRVLGRPEQPAASRYVYYPDHMVRMPSPFARFRQSGVRAALGDILSLFTEPIFTGMLSSGLSMMRRRETWVGGHPAPADISIGDYFAGLFGRPDMVQNMMSAVTHGIYGGDIWKLSLRNVIFESIWLTAKIRRAGITVPQGTERVTKKDWLLVRSILTDASLSLLETLEASTKPNFLLGFKGGMSTLPNAMAAYLASQKNVTIKLNERIDNISNDNAAKKLTLQATHSGKVGSKSNQRRVLHDKVISTLFSKTLSKLLPPEEDITSTLARTHAVSITVVNLWYPHPHLNRPYTGFGYLIPQSVPFEQNPEGALGVLFDSDLPSSDTVPGTKLTVMLGGHYWTGWRDRAETMPSAADTIAAARRVVERHLGIPAGMPGVRAQAHNAVDCIPQQHVGHRAAMGRAHFELLAAFGGRLAVAGSSYGAVGVLPSLRAARDAAAHAAGDSSGEFAGATGLAAFETDEEDFLFVPRDYMPFRHGNGMVHPDSVQVDE